MVFGLFPICVVPQTSDRVPAVVITLVVQFCQFLTSGDKRKHSLEDRHRIRRRTMVELDVDCNWYERTRPIDKPFFDVPSMA